MRDEILNSLVSTAQYELFTYPHLTLGFRIKNLARKILKRYPVPNDRFNWPIGIMVRGLIDVVSGEEDDTGDKAKGNARDNAKVVKSLSKYADSWASHGARFYNIDDALAAEVFVYLYEKTGGEGYKMAADEMYSYLSESRKDAEGSLVYRPNQDNETVAADMIGLVVPFLIKYGRTFDVPEAVELAYTQIKNFLIYGMDEETGLPVHAYEIIGEKHFGLVGWGRAVGWLMMGMAYFLTENGEQYDDVRNAFDSLEKNVRKYVGEDGLFSWHITEIDGHVDTSASAMILDAIAMVRGVEDEMVIKGVAALKEKITDGTVIDALGECTDYGVHPQYYGAFPWALGPTMSLLSRGEDTI